MNRVKHILVATDGSELSQKAAAFGGDLARALGAKVSVVMVHDEQIVIPDAWAATGIAGSDLASTEDIRRRIEAKTLAEELVRAADAIGHLPAAPTKACLWGRAADEICAYAENHDVDMIVLGSHGRTGIKRAILGSVSHAVANQAHCAITIIR